MSEHSSAGSDSSDSSSNPSVASIPLDLATTESVTQPSVISHLPRELPMEEEVNTKNEEVSKIWAAYIEDATTDGDPNIIKEKLREHWNVLKTYRTLPLFASLTENDLQVISKLDEAPFDSIANEILKRSEIMNTAFTTVQDKTEEAYFVKDQESFEQFKSSYESLLNEANTAMEALAAGISTRLKLAAVILCSPDTEDEHDDDYWKRMEKLKWSTKRPQWIDYNGPDPETPPENDIELEGYNGPPVVLGSEHDLGLQLVAEKRLKKKKEVDDVKPAPETYDGDEREEELQTRYIGTAKLDAASLLLPLSFKEWMSLSADSGRMDRALEAYRNQFAALKGYIDELESYDSFLAFLRGEVNIHEG